MQNLILTFLLTLAFSMPLYASMDRSYMAPPFGGVPTEKLMEQGLSYLNQTNHPDSAMMCMTVIAARTQGRKHPSRHEAELAVRALRISGQIYAVVYGDYTRSSMQLLRALQLAEANRLEDRKLPILFNLANHRYQEGNLNERPGFATDAFGEFKKMFLLSAKTGGRPLLDYISANIAVIGLVNGLEDEMWLRLGNRQRAGEVYGKLLEANADDHMLAFEINKSLMAHSNTLGDTPTAEHHELLMMRAREKARHGLHRLEDSSTLLTLDKLQSESAMLAATGRMQRYQVWTVSCLSAVLLGLLVLLWYKFRQVRANERHLFKRTEELTRLNASGLHTVACPAMEKAAAETDGSETLYQRVCRVLATNAEVYSEEFSTGRLAELVGARPAEGSAEVQAVTGSSTTALIASARISEACRRMSDQQEYGQWTIEAIGQSVGYKSRSYFVAIFKKTVGLSPSEYISQARNREKAGVGTGLRIRAALRRGRDRGRRRNAHHSRLPRERPSGHRHGGHTQPAVRKPWRRQQVHRHGNPAQRRHRAFQRHQPDLDPHRPRRTCD